ncbi:Pyruvate carboxyltransferase [Senna tora]|uniref:Pyruvate carboxyltransferase n=1 Tax=Senna tora TaxID=362788 RepID=A0A834WJQ8_9FABA|nr:Pyruvate carboxyltransferase [Senna tora]
MASQWDASSLIELHPLKRRKTITMAQNPREIGWTDSSDSDSDVDMEEAMDPNDQPNPLPPRLHLGPELLQKFSVIRLQCIIDHLWQLQGPVRVVGRVQDHFMLYFEILDDMYFMANNSPWAVHGGLLAVFPWEHNMVLNRLVVTEVSVSVQLWGLPLEYQTTLVAQRIGEMLGEVRGIDCSCGFNAVMNESSNFVVIVGGWDTHIQIADGLGHRRSTFVAAFHTPLGVVYRPCNPDPMQFEVQPDEEVTLPTNDTLHPHTDNHPDEELDPLAEEWFNNIDIDEDLLPTLGLELIESDNDDPITPSIENTETQHMEIPLPNEATQLENLDPELESLMEKYCSQPSPIPHPSPSVRLSDDIQEGLSQEQGFKEDSQWQDILEVDELLPHPLLRPAETQIEVGESSSVRQSLPVQHQHFDTKEMTAGTILPSRPLDSTFVGLNNRGTLLDVVNHFDPYDDFTAASILNPIPEEPPTHVHWEHPEEDPDDSASLVFDEFDETQPVLVEIPVDGTDNTEHTANEANIIPHSSTQPPNPMGPSLPSDNRVEFSQPASVTERARAKKKALTTKELTQMFFKRAKLALVAVSVNLTKNMYLAKIKGKRKLRAEPEDTEDGVADLKRARKGLTAEVQEVFKWLID